MYMLKKALIKIHHHETAKDNSSHTSQYARGLIEASLDPLITINSEGRVIDVNDATVKITGVPRMQIIDTNFSNYFTEPAKSQAVYRRALKDGSIANYQLTVRHTSNKRFTDVLYNATVQKDENGKIIGTFVALSDITERKRAEVESARIAQELTNLIDTANAPIFGIDKNGRVTEWNRTAVTITGYEKAETLGRNLVEEFITEEYKTAVREVLDKALTGMETANFEFPLYTRRKDRRDVLLNATTRRDVQGNIIGVIGVGQDITERKKAEVESARIAQELANFIDTVNAPIFGIDKNGRVTEWNRTAVTITGYEKAETLGRNLVEEFITEEYKTAVREVLDKALTGMETANFEFPLYTRRKDRRDVLLNATTRRDVQGNIIGVIGVGQDITERKQLEKKLAQYAQGLEGKVVELERFQRLTVGRELKMIELKREIEELRKLSHEA